MRSACAWACLALLGGCGEQAVGGDYQGEALFTLGGVVRLASTALDGDATGELKAALFWARSGSQTSTLFSSVGAVEQDVDATSTFPANFALTLRRPPASSLIGTAPDVSGAYALAMVLVYVDEDGDARWDRDQETLVGAAPGAFLLYAPDGLTGGRFGALAAGFHLLQAPAAGICEPGAAAPADPATLSMLVYGSYPEEALLDLDCDGESQEWSGTCPDLATVFDACRDDLGIGLSAVCATCEPLLWRDGADDHECDEWRDECEHITDQEECEDAALRCHEGPRHGP